VGDACGEIVFFDGDFDSGWSYIDFECDEGGSSVVSNVSSGGNPRAYRKVVSTMNAGSGSKRRILTFNWKSDAIYDPRTQGAILSIDYSEDAISFTSRGAAFGMALRQDGKVYYHNYGGITWSSWVHIQDTNLTADDFYRQYPGTSGCWGYERPDFSENGSTIEFGFHRGDSTGGAGAGAVTSSGIDNWSVTIRRN